MRILVVSAHYPPNFVSGGTLAPQRQAQGLRRRGHDVSVYAGWLGAERPPLSTWTDVDEEGMEVRWMVTTPWTDWSNEANFDNPAVTADFASHLHTVRPDIVHLHSLQSLGAGLVAAAADAGASVVVTMHDFWWLCGRQFLVDTEYRPCCLVVSCGVCSCHVDRPWLDSRTARLARHLERADVILAVSRAEAEVLVANGIDESRLRVDENGVPDAEPEALAVPIVRTDAAAVPASPARQRPLRLTYAGGPDRMKGTHVLLDAVRLLEDRPGWHLTAYGIQPFLDAGVVTLDSAWVTVAPAFDPGDIEMVFASTDVLVVPSVMRETYSLITREALTRGVPVVCTDTLGPEEVVEDEHNGIVVPAGDAEALAGALTRLLDEEDLLDLLKAGCHTAPVRSVADQLDGLDAIYRELAETRSAPAVDAAKDGRADVGNVGRSRRVQRVLFIVGIEGAPLRYRARLPAEALAQLGVHCDVHHYRDPTAMDLAVMADAVVVYRVPATDQILELITTVRAGGTPVFFDVDDLIFDPDLQAEIPAMAILEGAEADLWLEGVRRYRTTMEACDVFIGSTDLLCRHAEEVVGLPSARFANGVGMEMARAADVALGRPRAPGPVRIGYLSGTDTHDRDWRMVEPLVADLMSERLEVELWLGGLLRTSPALDVFGQRVHRMPFLPWRELPTVLRDLDVNLAPLEPGSRFNEAKSAIKWLEAALTATPTIASPTEAFREAVDTGRNGLLAATPDEWMAALRSMVTDSGRRARLGHRARRDALLRWSPHLQGARYLEILEGSWPERRSARPADSWRPVSHDEPYSPVALEAYVEEPDDQPVTGGAYSGGSDGRIVGRARLLRGRLLQVRSLAGETARSLHRHGLRATGLRAVHFVRRRRPRIEANLRRVASSVRSRLKGRPPRP
ncbi:MAG TPA: glycosyltransferase [Acidimicrobiales bacterium]|nr:glycosyltransferase [Acidimicrobiales bacterium]